MSARKLSTSGAVSQKITLSARETNLVLPPDAVRIQQNGIEFRSANAIPLWAEMTLSLDCPYEGKLNCNGVIVGCNGNRHSGYLVSVLFTGLSKQAQARLNSLAYS
ncbi:MAG: hypothetical protein RLZZ350_1052 [Verrucomicrobiota bacterium]|jgi:hypothetical protein